MCIFIGNKWNVFVTYKVLGNHLFYNKECPYFSFSVVFSPNTSIIWTVVLMFFRFIGELMDQMEHFKLSVGVIMGDMATRYSRSQLFHVTPWLCVHSTN